MWCQKIQIWNQNNLCYFVKTRKVRSTCKNIAITRTEQWGFEGDVILSYICQLENRKLTSWLDQWNTYDLPFSNLLSEWRMTQRHFYTVQSCTNR